MQPHHAHSPRQQLINGTVLPIDSKGPRQVLSSWQMPAPLITRQKALELGGPCLSHAVVMQHPIGTGLPCGSTRDDNEQDTGRDDRDLRGQGGGQEWKGQDMGDQKC